MLTFSVPIDNDSQNMTAQTIMLAMNSSYILLPTFNVLPEKDKQQWRLIMLTILIEQRESELSQAVIDVTSLLGPGTLLSLPI